MKAKTQFNNPETFSRAFKRMFEMQPSHLRKQGSIDRRRLMPRLSSAHIRHISKGRYLKPDLKEKSAFQVAGLMTLVRDDLTVTSELWDLFAQELERCENSTRPGDYYGIAFYPQGWENHGFLYMAAVETPEPEVVEAPLVAKTIPASQYARFIHKGPTRDLPLTLDYVYHTWWPKSGKSLSYPWVLERCGQDFRDAEDEEAEREIYIPIQ